ncbi:NADH dehydrogenase [Rhizomicrobium palustre]|uniref:NADH dehydrogenase n=1 Tax=Rhizomicrobium palustre TaxID=189966 RepID=A0A846MU07_9PROT|nr:complex I NDUFA9 subunit family protein [Rhizomicrobium palustre]NIK86836.1 NADH dehydrogenase [Rhizomicrobium palustre]
MQNDLVVVFGASGFLGRHAVRALAKEGYRIRAVTRRPNLANFLLPAGQVGQIQIVKGNINREEDIAKAVAGAAIVVNCTGVLYGHGKQGFESINCDAPGRIARAALAAGVTSLVHVSALGADTESDSGYARSKGLGERNMREAFPRVTILRPSLVFGPEDSFFNRFAQMARFLPALPLIGGGQTKFQPVYVADVAAAILKAVQDVRTAGRTYQLGGPKTYSFKELLQFILAETGRKRLLLPLPSFIASVMGFVAELPSFLLPIRPVLTVDQVRLLKADNVVQPGAFTLDDLGITPASVESIVPGYLWRFHPKGQFKDQVAISAR